MGGILMKLLTITFRCRQYMCQNWFHRIFVSSSCTRTIGQKSTTSAKNIFGILRYRSQSQWLCNWFWLDTSWPRWKRLSVRRFKIQNFCNEVLWQKLYDC